MSLLDRVYPTLCVLFAALIVVYNLTYRKFVSLPFISIELSVGAIVYSLTFLITDLIVEFYDKIKAGFCTRLALTVNVVVILVIGIMDNLDATSWSPVDGNTFHKIFGLSGVSLASSIIACYISQSIDIKVYLIHKLTKGRLLWLRSNISTMVSLFVDTFVVINIMGIFDALPKENIWPLIINSYFFNFVFHGVVLLYYT